MEEDIKMLEWSQQQMRLGNLPDYNQKVYKAIENLINRNKELEDTINDLVQVKQDACSISYTMPSKLAKASIEVLVNSGLRIENEKLKNENHDLKEQLENYIQKSKVKEKIEELEEKLKYYESLKLPDLILKAKIQVLQELLEE